MSKITGGKFANGAVTGAFVYMYNHALHEAQKDLADLESMGGSGEIVNPSGTKNGFYVKSGKFIYTSDHTPINYTDQRAGALILSVVPGTGAMKVGSYAYRYFMANPERVIGAIEITNDIFNPSAPIPTTVKGTYGAAIKSIFEL